MTLELTPIDLYNLMVQAHEQSEHIYQLLDLGYQFRMPQQISQGDACLFELRGELEIEIRSLQL